jgi:hypothetical protein
MVMTSERKSSSGIACSLSCWPVSAVRTAGGINSMTWTAVEESCTRRLSVKEWIADLVALYVGVKGSGTNASREETFMMTASAFPARNAVNALSIRIGPSRLVVTVASATVREPGSRRFSGSMMPATLIRTLSSGCVPVIVWETAAIEVGSSTSSRTASIPSWSATIRSQQVLASTGDDHLVARVTAQ